MRRAWEQGDGVGHGRRDRVGVNIASDWHTEMVTEGGVC